MHTVSFSPSWFLWHLSRCKHCSRGSHVSACLSTMEVIFLSYTKRNWKLTKYLIYGLPSMVLIQLFYTSPNSCNTSKRHLFIKWWMDGEENPSPFVLFSSVQFSSVTQSYPTLYDPMNCSMPGLPVHHQLQEFTQTHVHWVSDATQPSHSLSSPSPPALNLS